MGVTRIFEDEDYPKNLMEFERRFSTEAACLSYLEQLRWPEGFRCPVCRCAKAWQTKRGTFFCSSCKRQTSVTAGTTFEGTRKPLRLWFRAIWLVVGEKHGISALGVQRQLGLSRYETAWKMLRKLRQAMVRPNRDFLSGEVEVDETLVGGPQAGRHGRDIEGKSLVVIAAERNGDKTGRIRMQRIAHAGSSMLEGFVKNNVQKGAVVTTDGWKGYLGVSQLGYRHQPIKGESVGIQELLPRVHRVAALLKRWLLGTHHGRVEKIYLDDYLNEFTFRFNRRTSGSRGKLFYRLIQQVAIVSPATTYGAD
ncbi:MAG: IS1595 family transposase [Candidatus Melainabacteria bacterium]|nr:IS1595 family transposase [Candidatus Melainabacteria bacterium]